MKKSEEMMAFYVECTGRRDRLKVKTTGTIVKLYSRNRKKENTL